MLVRKKYRRKPLGIAATIVFFVLYFAVFFDSPVLDTCNDWINQLVVGRVTQLKTTFYNVISVLSNSTMALVYTLILVVVLWMMRWKIPALWVSFTVGLGLVAGYGLRWILRATNNGAKTALGFAFPGLHVLGMVLLLAIVYAIFLPYFGDRALAVLVGFILVIWLLATINACLFFHIIKPTDTVGALLLGFAWVSFSSLLYRSYAQRMLRFPLLEDSNI